MIIRYGLFNHIRYTQVKTKGLCAFFSSQPVWHHVLSFEGKSSQGQQAAIKPISSPWRRGASVYYDELKQIHVRLLAIQVQSTLLFLLTYICTYMYIMLLKCEYIPASKSIAILQCHVAHHRGCRVK